MRRTSTADPGKGMTGGKRGRVMRLLIVASGQKHPPPERLHLAVAQRQEVLDGGRPFMGESACEHVGRGAVDEYPAVLLGPLRRRVGPCEYSRNVDQKKRPVWCLLAVAYI